jgi:hypothetical protein
VAADFLHGARVGCSTLLETLDLQDIAHGGGMMLIDPHRDWLVRSPVIFAGDAGRVAP